eukprot:600916-Prymnesium_polylepis.1
MHGQRRRPRRAHVDRQFGRRHLECHERAAAQLAARHAAAVGAARLAVPTAEAAHAALRRHRRVARAVRALVRRLSRAPAALLAAAIGAGGRRHVRCRRG